MLNIYIYIAASSICTSSLIRSKINWWTIDKFEQPISIWFEHLDEDSASNVGPHAWAEGQGLHILIFSGKVNGKVTIW